MTDKTKHNLRKGVGIFLSVWTAFVGIAFIVQAWRIYSFGDKAYTTARISAYFRQIAVPVYVWLAAVVIGGVVFCIMPPPKARLTPYIDLKHTLARLHSRLPEYSAEGKKLQKRRIIAQCICAAACLGCVVVASIWLFSKGGTSANSGFFAAHEEAERILRALVWIVAAIGLAIGTAYLVESTYKKQIAFAKSELVANAKKGIKVNASAEERVTLKGALLKRLAFTQAKWFTLSLRIAIAVAAVAFVIIGIFNGGMAAVLFKAINICTQCIGIG